MTAEQGTDLLPSMVWPVGPQGVPLELGTASLPTRPQVLFLTLKNLSWVIFVYLFLSSDVFLYTQFKVCVLSFLFAKSLLSSWTAFFIWCGLNESGPHRLTYLNAWSPGMGTIWEELGGLPKEVCPWALDFGISKSQGRPSVSLSSCCL